MHENIVQVDLTQGIHRSSGHVIALGDAYGNRFGARVFKGKSPADLDGAKALGLFVRADGATVTVEGTVNGNTIYVDLLPECYAVMGTFTLTIKAIYKNVVATVRMIEGSARVTRTDQVVDPGQTIPSIEIFFSDDTVEKVITSYLKRNPIQYRPLFANGIAECEDTNLTYILPDGYIYAYLEGFDEAHRITQEAQTGGYWYADEWNPTGAWKENASCSAKRTNIFAVTPGDQLSYKGNGAASVHSVAWLDAEQGYLSEEYFSAASAVTVTVPEGAAYAWFQSFAYVTSTSGVTLEVEWILCQAGEQTYSWQNTGHAFVPADYEDRIIALESAVKEMGSAADAMADVLRGKKIVYDGDSIAESRANNGGGYAQIIADATGGSFENQAVGGARLCSSTERHSVVDNLPNLPADGDLYCFEGGINDFWGNTPIGECSLTDYTGALDKSTICGAMETIFRHCLNTFVGKPICFVIVHKVQNTAWTINANGDSFRDYHDAMVKVCEKYSIPYYDAFLESGLNGWHAAQSAAYLTANSAGTADGIHPNAEGYRRYYVPQLMAMFRSMMVIE